MLLMSEMAVSHNLRHLPPEPWGRRLKRAREDIAGFNLNQAAAMAGYFVICSDSTISRLETLHEMPEGPRGSRRRQLAYVLCLAYRIDPIDLGLDSNDTPPGLALPGDDEEWPVTIGYPTLTLVAA